MQIIVVVKLSGCLRMERPVREAGTEDLKLVPAEYLLMLPGHTVSHIGKLLL